MALQLFAHLGGEALNVALLMLKGEREKWEGLSNGLSAYYNSPGRLAVFWRRFESAFRQPGMDPATFATELGILAVRGFGDMGKRARDAMIRDQFIAGQRHCGLRRHFDGFAAECVRVIQIGSRARTMTRTGILGGSPAILGNLNVNGWV